MAVVLKDHEETEKFLAPIPIYICGTLAVTNCIMVTFPGCMYTIK